jgi:hypothetical protein
MFGVGTATLVAATVVVPRFAGAAEAAPAVQLEICNNLSKEISANIVGANQDGQQVTAPTVRVEGYERDALPCTTLQDWWWKTDSDINISGDGVWTQTCHIPSSAQNGSTYKIYPVLRGCS